MIETPSITSSSYISRCSSSSRRSIRLHDGDLLLGHIAFHLLSNASISVEVLVACELTKGT